MSQASSTPLGEAPPRGWGGPAASTSLITGSRGTPTRVGRTGSVTPHRLRHRGTPTRVGRTGEARLEVGDVWEAPPRGWGGRGRRRPSPGAARGTPTRVGRTSSAATTQTSGWRHPPRVGRTGVTAVKGFGPERHPHAGGEDRAARSAPSTSNEAPPRGWGGPRTRWLSLARRGGTPTRVGRTERRRDLRMTVDWRHPHAGGEDRSVVSISFPCREAPPRGWGGLRRQHCRRGAVGGTPTRVGRTAPDAAATTITARHPHAGGEDARPRATTHAPMRGTPTRVGRTRPTPRRSGGAGRHPHAGGEDSARHCVRAGLTEAPPRGWGGPATEDNRPSGPRGTPTRVGRTTSQRRLSGGLAEAPPRGWGGLTRRAARPATPGGTPTRVGRTDPTRSTTGDPGRHPHAGGEDAGPSTGNKSIVEAPPRGWGGPPRRRCLSATRGGTPTRVGRTHFQVERTVIGQRHPHAGGEDGQP